ncbi:hypothetical protein [Ammoniphilus sp. CFH 90114]|uniref:hypothetical protein n=1 Tax=Ammoniphilus sp. CFH 90114 TaxID=2493665 RepID=UPI00100FCAF7|nr:hypothetical protein [Ammoniphilus sp. CFH 90114]RXT14974.1 hypothetical protein EIZ39_01835 [Ammoniphilus sp. CFH 90114]
MKTYEVMEYSNITLRFEKSQIECLIEALVEAGLPIAWKETKRYFTLSIQTSWTTQRLTFEKHGKSYKLKSKNYNIRDQRFAQILQQFIHDVKGHAVLKLLSNDQLVVQNIRYGEPVRIVEIKGPNKKILFEKECIVTMEQVHVAILRKDAEERIPVLKLEIDYELARLFEAIQNGDVERIGESKEVLEKLRQEMLMLEV